MFYTKIVLHYCWIKLAILVVGNDDDESVVDCVLCIAEKKCFICFLCHVFVFYMLTLSRRMRTQRFLLNKNRGFMLYGQSISTNLNIGFPFGIS